MRKALNDLIARGGTSRRGFLMGVAALAAARRSEAASAPVLAYAGCFSSPKGPEGSKGRGRGICLFEMNPATGALTERALFPSGASPSWLAFDPSRTHLYSANEIDEGSVSAYAIDRASGQLTLLNTVSSRGAGPTHLSVHPSGKWLFVANYYGGTVAVLPVRPGGELGEATDVHVDRGTVGPERAASAPPGSFAISGHDRPHAHMVQPDPAGRYVLASDLGLDCIFVWKFDAEKGKLIANDPPSVALPPGDGPRHFVFHPNGRRLYSLQEEASTLVAFDYDAARGRLTPKQTISTLPEGFRGTNFTSGVLISHDAKFLYAANRLHDTIAWFSIGANGTLAFAGEEWTRGDYPRSFTFDPTGNFLYSCNQRADAIAAFRVNRKTGALAFTGQYTAVGTPSILIFLT
ncbi:MAG: lactonase family protein [Acidobacteriota bacterium]